jgi:ADP-heptose:LPS heptosyltransferase
MLFLFSLRSQESSMSRPGDTARRRVLKILGDLYRPTIAVLLAYGFRPIVIAGRALRLLPPIPAIPEQPQRILVVYLSPHLGDAVMLMPMLERLREAHPKAKVELAIDSLGAPFFRMLPWLDHVYGVKVSDGVRRRFFTILGVWRLVRAYRETMQNLSVDICVMPRWGDDAYRSHYLAYLIGAPRRIGWRSKRLDYCDALLSEKYDDGSSTLDAVRFCRLLVSSGLIPACNEGGIANSSVRSMSEIAAATPWRSLAERLGIDHRPFAIISPGASHPSRRWTIEGWLVLMRWLRQRGLQIVILSGPGDADVAQQLYNSDNETVLVAGRTTLTESATVISHATLFLGNDSGPGHIAGALGVPALIVMASQEGCRPDGPSSPARIRPIGPHVAYCQPRRCLAPCNDFCTADSAHCITSVSAGDALLKLESLWHEALQGFVAAAAASTSDR